MTRTKNIIDTTGLSEGNYCYTRDCVLGLFTILLKGENGEAYNVSNPKSHTTIGKMAHLVANRIAYKWFEFGKDEEGNELPKTVISREFSSEWKPGDEPYYPVNDEKNGTLYAEYKKLADAEEKVIFGGRLGEYKYYDMDAVIASALDMCERELQ